MGALEGSARSSISTMSSAGRAEERLRKRMEAVAKVNFIIAIGKSDLELDVLLEDSNWAVVLE